MPIDTSHPEYKKRQKQWKRCRDCAAGTDAVKDEGEKYLPKLSGQSYTEYEGYKMRAYFFGATGRTIQGLLGAVFRKDIQYDFPAAQEANLDTITLDGKNLLAFTREEVKEVLITGRIGIMADVPNSGNTDRAYLALYKAENILNWKTEVINGKLALTRVFLSENYDVPKQNDKFDVDQKQQIRVLILDQAQGNPQDANKDPQAMPDNYVYRQEVWRKINTDKGEQWALYQSITPMRRGVALDFIPFQFVNAHDLTTDTDKPPLLDLVDVNLSHYRTSADLEHGAHFTALPTAWVAGFDTEDELRIGSGVAWVTDNAQARAGFLEFSGAGLSSLRDIKTDKEAAMAVLGARLLEEQKKAAESADTHRLRASGEMGALVAIAVNVSDGMTKALEWMAWWSGGDTVTTEFELNTDFVNARLTPQEITALMGAWQQGAISQETFLDNMKRGEILPQGTTIEDEKDLIDAEANQPSKNIADAGNQIPPQRQFTLVKDQQGNTVGIQEGGANASAQQQGAKQ